MNANRSKKHSNIEINSTTKLQMVSKNTSNLFYAMLESSEKGLSLPTVEEKIKKFGYNEIEQDKVPSWYKQFVMAFINPFIAVLVILVIISAIMDVWIVSPEERDFKTIIVVGSMIIISSILRFWQEYNSNRAAENLKNMVKTTATVFRRNQGKVEVNIREIVPGDIVHLSAGDMIPADLRIIKSKDLFVSQAILTGESHPLEKRDEAIVNAENKSPLELENLCFMGTNVVSGTAIAIVVTTGNQTYLGSIGKAISGKKGETSFDRGVNKVSWLLIRYMLVMVPLVFLINGLTKGDWLQALLFAVAIAVGLTPEMLPMIVTANLAKGAKSMSKQKVIVKKLNAIQNIGAMDILCTDKTGTLTLDKIVLERHLNVLGHEDDEVLKWTYLNSFHQTGLKNLLDIAILEHVEVHDYLKVEEDYLKVDEIPFDFQRRRMSVILEKKNKKQLLICKGAVEEMLDLCTHAFYPGENSKMHAEKDSIIALDAQMKKTVLNTSRKLNEDGLRVLLVAIKEYNNPKIDYNVEDESNLILTGFIGFLDPAKPSAKPALEKLQKLGIQVKVLTGDNEIVTRKICKDVGIPFQNIVLGADIELLNDDELSKKIKDISIFAKLNPVQKSRIVTLLQKQNFTVGFMGDGINDAPALRKADVGISVDTAVDIAKESADIILLEKDLRVLQKGVVYGRRTFGNIIKYIKMTTSSNFGNMFSMIGASIFLPFLPMLPIHLLIQNLLYDISQTSIPWDKMDEEFMERSQKWDTKGISRFMIYIGPISSFFDYITFAVMFFVFKANSPEHQNLFQTGWFVEGLLSQTLIVHMIRTRKVPFIQSWATAPVVALTSLIMLIGISLPFTPLAESIHLQPLPLSYFPWLIAILFSYCLLTQFIKNRFIKKFHQWL
ncbi:magnesium-translocating P-type ATPase [Apibacter muscae]|uniref:magnesium-translocating P-type ATPase n=1 Tax=Apibacter muscae TaxID=2509004 RepID=UPI0011ABEB39|nr:magnesium-translocating P-type ATPase [Apibacter muscae]TWP24386.1 magnesium-translocating P-type ATPase [Apibacter muscae]